jgi:diketogulonate reductase-like aldo/keto reductase
MTALTITSTLPLNNGVAMPRFGLGVYQTGSGKRTENAVLWALEAGYRQIDTAALYGNEAEVGRVLKRAIAEGKLKRADVFVTTKLWNSDHGYDRALRAFDKSMALLGLEQLDLYLIHWPVAGGRRDSWRALEKLLADGRVRAIGVSNYTRKHLEELLGEAKVAPAVNQIELHPFGQQRDTVAYCRTHGIAVTAYSPLTKGHKLDDPKLLAVAKAVGRSPAQVLIRWSLQRDFVVIPKSADRARIQENAQVFDFALTAAQMATLDALDRDEHITWDPTDAP